MVAIRRLADPPPLTTVPRDGLGRPMVVAPDGGFPEAYTRASTFADAVEDKTALDKWKLRMALVGASLDPSIIKRIRALDGDGSQRKSSEFKDGMAELAEEAKDAAGANVASTKGTYLHGLTEFVDAATSVPEGASVDDLMDIAAYMLLVEQYGLQFTHREQFVVCPEFQIGGTPDGIAYCPVPDPDGQVGYKITDLKTSQSLDFSALKFAMQLAIYAHGQFYDPTVHPAPPRLTKSGKSVSAAWTKWRNTLVTPEMIAPAYSPIPEVSQSWGMILHIPSGSGEATMHWIDLSIGWTGVGIANDVRELRKLRSKTLVACPAPRV